MIRTTLCTYSLVKVCESTSSIPLEMNCAFVMNKNGNNNIVLITAVAIIYIFDLLTIMFGQIKIQLQ